MCNNLNTFVFVFFLLTQVTNLENQTDILTQVDSWYIHFKEYWEYNFKMDEGDGWLFNIHSFFMRSND